MLSQFFNSTVQKLVSGATSLLTTTLEKEAETLLPAGSIEAAGEAASHVYKAYEAISKNPVIRQGNVFGKLKGMFTRVAEKGAEEIQRTALNILIQSAMDFVGEIFDGIFGGLNRLFVDNNIKPIVHQALHSHKATDEKECQVIADEIIERACHGFGTTLGKEPAANAIVGLVGQYYKQNEKSSEGDKGEDSPVADASLPSTQIENAIAQIVGGFIASATKKNVCTTPHGR
jgi:hypothetical protein